MKIRKGDTVAIIAGKDKGQGKDVKTGKVLSIDRKKETVIVEGVNVGTFHKKPRSVGDPGGRIQKERPIHISNVMYYDQKQRLRAASDSALRTARKSATQRNPARRSSRGGTTLTSRLKERYVSEIVPKMMEDFQYKNVMQVPKLHKIVLNMGVTEAKDNAKALEGAVKDMQTISGQKPIVTKARKSIANFKLREGMNVGCKVTLRGDKMYDFLDKLVSVALPRVRDFRGVSASSFDGRGNYALGIKEQLIFPEIEYDQIDQIRGMDIIIVTSAETDEEARAFLELMGMPFRK